MSKRRPERAIVETLIKENRRRKARDIAEEAGLIESMGDEDKAVDYVRRVKRSMKETGELPVEKYKFASDEERLEDLQTLFELRKGKRIEKRVAHAMLLLNCYYRYRSEDGATHWGAIDDTYEKNKELLEPLELSNAIGICQLALLKYTESKDKKKNEAARERGLPGAGLNYASETLIAKLAITEEELQHMKSIRRG